MGAPKGKHLFGMVKVGEKGQIVIPKDARDIFDIKPGDGLIVLGDEERGLALVKSQNFVDLATELLTMKESGENDECH